MAAALLAGLLDAPSVAEPGSANRQGTLKWRTIEFPREQTLGALFLVHTRAPYGFFSQEKPIGLARGSVHVPQNANVRLKMSPQTAEALPALLSLKSDDIQSLDLVGCNIDDQGWKYLRNLTGLIELRLSDNQLHDKSIGKIDTFKKLRCLVLSRTAVTDRCLAAIEKLKELQILVLTGCSVTDQGVVGLPACRRLDTIDLSQTTVGDPAIVALASLPLFELDLTRTRITDAGVIAICKVRTLRRLHLDRCRISDRCVPALMKTGIRVLDIRDTQISPDSVKRLQAALPQGAEVFSAQTYKQTDLR